MVQERGGAPVLTRGGTKALTRSPRGLRALDFENAPISRSELYTDVPVKVPQPGIHRPEIGSSQDSLISQIHSLIRRFDTLLTRNKFPIPSAREFYSNALIKFDKLG